MFKRLNHISFVLISALLIGCGGGGSAPSTSSSTSNHAPVADNKSITLQEDSSTNIILSGSDVDGDTLTYSYTQPAHGTFDGTTYTPNANYHGSDSFTYTTNDGTVNSAPATVTISVTAVNDAPVADDKSVTVNEDSSANITLSGSDVDGDTLTYSYTQPAHGTLSGTVPNLTYAPASGYSGSDSFTYTANDGTVDSAPATVRIDVVGKQTINVSTVPYVKSLGKQNSIIASVDMGDQPRSLYILFTNESQSASATISHNAKIAVVAKKSKIYNPLNDKISPKIIRDPAYVQAFNAKVKKLLHTGSHAPYQEKSINYVSQSRKSIGDVNTFYLDDYAQGSTTQATLRKIVSNISTVFGNKTLNVWVSNDSFGSGCAKARCVTQAMVDTLADQFLKAGSDNDIYDWVTNIYGEEWGSDAQAKYGNFIAANDEITILLTDIDNDNSPNGGTIGYFYAKDNFVRSSVSGSNERIMFYADAVMFANTDNNGLWQKEMYSTLAHEFQHMIHFYQKSVLRDADDDTWINEMLSETTEDLIATKIEHTGPRGVDPSDGSAGSSGNTKGRYPLFNANNTLSLTTWNNALANYSEVSAFGTFLTRNYGGAKVLHDIVYNSLKHEDAVMDAVHQTPQGSGKTFADLLREWGVAVMLSDDDNLQDLPTYNTGDFTVDNYNNSMYELGSINFFNYNLQPTLQTSSGTVAPQGNYYYKVGENLTGVIDINLSLNGTTEATIIVK